MENSKAELLDDIDSTIDRLIENANAIKSIQEDSIEKQALEKLQESLLARLIHRESYQSNEKTLKSIRQESVHEKIAEFARGLSKTHQKRARSRKARSKSRG